jgi:hypothetical protein
MIMDVVGPLITGMFLGGIVAEMRWIGRLRELQHQLDLSRSAEREGLAPAGDRAKEPEREAQSSRSLRSLQDHLAGEAERAPLVEPSTAGKRDQ